ncbi:PhyH-domain-containing protein [Sistotremastrum suecicum HHB10207 ss-3]|uniref:PhyH-domain-containing protein n=1 Tax=Sistotremastrum suecicum HHB10207 ss-3 TaxID=1314776 RepID=A0A165ZXV7_9AGAM|nr:PhyH-domain-containing protein [Sistotremastrum suecicum HHB10207 ss-3]
MRSLTESEKSSFQENGFLKLTDLLTKEEVDSLVRWTSEVKNLPNVVGEHMPYEEIDATGKRVLCRTENYCNYHSGFNGILRGEAALSVLQQLSGEKMHLFKEKINYKQPHAGGFDAHFDAPAYNHIKATKHLTILMAVEPATLENGCLEVVPGSHRQPIPLGEDRCITKEWCDMHDWVPVPLDTGELLIFGSYLAHRSGANHSSLGRAAIYATYNCDSDGGDIHDEYYVHRRKLWPPTHERLVGEKYEEGAVLYGFGSPMLTIQEKA